MEHNWLLYFTAFLCAFSVSLFMTPYIKTLALKVGAIDYPKDRGVHKTATPRMGGLAIVIGFMVTMVVISPFVHELKTLSFLGFIVGALIIVAMGIVDDINNLSAKVKLPIQMLASLIVVSTGTVIDNLNIIFIDSIPYSNELITMFWIIGVTNAVNIIDGVDGLAAGVVSICSICLTILCIITGSSIAVFFTASLAGSCLGFLPRNFSPAEIFMGDTGSTFLGFVLAVSSIIGVYKSYALLAVVICVLAIALPILDTAFAILRRLFTGKPIMTADRGHLHHRLVDRGYSHKKTVFILYFISIVTSILAISIALENITVLLIVLVFTVILMAIVYAYKKRLS